MVLFNFLNFFTILLEFSIMRQVRTERNGTKRKFLFSTFLILFEPILAQNGAIMVLFNFFTIFFEFYIMRQEARERNDNFYFLPFSSPFNLFLLETEP